MYLKEYASVNVQLCQFILNSLELFWHWSISGPDRISIVCSLPFFRFGDQRHRRATAAALRVPAAKHRLALAFVVVHRKVWYMSGCRKLFFTFSTDGLVHRLTPGVVNYIPAVANHFYDLACSIQTTWPHP